MTLRITDLIDFVIVWAIVYGLLKLVRGTRAVQMAVGLLGVGLLYQISVIFGLETLQFVMRNTLLYFGFAILVIFAPEIRSALMRVGSNLGPFRFGHAKPSHEAYDDIVLASMTLSSRKVGALIVLERNVGLQNYIDTDAAAVVVSEETGVISFVQNGEITRYLNSSSLRELIRNALKPQGRLFEAVSPARRARRK